MTCLVCSTVRQPVEPPLSDIFFTAAVIIQMPDDAFWMLFGCLSNAWEIPFIDQCSSNNKIAFIQSHSHTSRLVYEVFLNPVF